MIIMIDTQRMLIELFDNDLVTTKHICTTTTRTKNFMMMKFWENDISEPRFIVMQSLIDAELYQQFFDIITTWNAEDRKNRANKNRRIRRNRNVMD